MDKSSSQLLQAASVDEILMKAEREGANNVLEKYRKLQCRSYLMMRYIELCAKSQVAKQN
jgi:hypothetical protein